MDWSPEAVLPPQVRGIPNEVLLGRAWELKEMATGFLLGSGPGTRNLASLTLAMTGEDRRHTKVFTNFPTMAGAKAAIFEALEKARDGVALKAFTAMARETGLRWKARVLALSSFQTFRDLALTGKKAGPALAEAFKAFLAALDAAVLEHLAVLANLRFAMSQARKMANCWRGKLGDCFDDLAQEAFVGLLQAVGKYMPKGIMFLSYAGWWIKDSMSKWVRKNLPPTLENGERAVICSLDAPVREGSDRTLGDTIAAPRPEDDVLHGVDVEKAKKELRKAIRQLRPRERRLLRARFGISIPRPTVEEVEAERQRELEFDKAPVKGEMHESHEPRQQP